jgi:hypothetical protein
MAAPIAMAPQIGACVCNAPELDEEVVVAVVLEGVDAKTVKETPELDEEVVVAVVLEVVDEKRNSTTAETARPATLSASLSRIGTMLWIRMISADIVFFAAPVAVAASAVKIAITLDASAARLVDTSATKLVDSSAARLVAKVAKVGNAAVMAPNISPRITESKAKALFSI